MNGCRRIRFQSDGGRSWTGGKAGKAAPASFTGSLPEVRYLPVRRLLLPVWESLPVLSGAGIEVPNHPALSQGKFADDALGSVIAGAGRIQKTELALLDREGGDVRLCPHVEMAELRTPDGFCRMPRSHGNQVVERDFEI